MDRASVEKKELLEKIIETEGSFSVTVRGDSMSPEVREGDLVTVEKADVRMLRAGDIILCRSRAFGFLVHRVIWTKGKIITMGDNLTMSDGALGEGDLIGRIVAIRRGEEELQPSRVRAFGAIARGLIIVLLSKALRKGS